MRAIGLKGLKGGKEDKRQRKGEELNETKESIQSQEHFRGKRVGWGWIRENESLGWGIGGSG